MTFCNKETKYTVEGMSDEKFGARRGMGRMDAVCHRR
jgi:hypothetical protein